jgi:hypothetical protein
MLHNNNNNVNINNNAIDDSSSYESNSRCASQDVTRYLSNPILRYLADLLPMYYDCNLSGMRSATLYKPGVYQCQISEFSQKFWNLNIKVKQSRYTP